MPQPHTDPSTSPTWRFVVHAQADRVFLQYEQSDGERSWHEMTLEGQDRWIIEQRLDPRGAHFSYCILNGSTLMNCGAKGLRIEPLLDQGLTPSPAVLTLSPRFA
ncbi:MAG: hypothetical protein ACOC3G_05515 [Phycisphaeraceae bacterium]